MRKLLVIIFLMNLIVSAQSENKKFFVSEIINSRSEPVGEYSSVVYSIKSIEGNLLYNIINKTDYDIPYSKLEVFNNGYSVLISAFYGTLAFFNNSGVKFKQIKLRADIDVEYERSVKSVIDINTLLVLFSDQKNEFSTIQKYNFNGENETSFNIEKINITGLAYSRTLNQICLSYIDWDHDGNMKKGVSLIDGSGAHLKDYNVNFKTGFYTEDNQLVAFSNKSLILINAESFELSFQNYPMNNEIFIDVTVFKGSIVAVSAKPPKLHDGKWYYKNPTIINLDLSGKIIDKNAVETSPFSEFGFNISDHNFKFIAGKEGVDIE